MKLPKIIGHIGILATLGSTQAIGMDSESLTRQISYTALHIADWQQTRRIAASAANGGPWIETNPILGPQPTQAEVNRYFAATLIGHWIIAYSLPESWREPFQMGTIVLQASVVQRNYNLGISASF